MSAVSTLGVYVSVPFCRAKCSFCNFASGVGTSSAMESYVVRLCAEIDAAAATADRLGAELPRVVDTIYFGGGTPSLLEPQQLRRVFATLRRNFDVMADAEITLEAAPGQIADAGLEAALRLGVNRVSLGVQSFVDSECAAVGRLHTGAECVREIVRLKAAGVAEVGADLIAGLPGQTHASLPRSLDEAANLAAQGALTHLSVYMLEIDEGSRLGREVIAGGPRFHAPEVPADEISAELYLAACERLERSGFAQYEISNFARLQAAAVKADGETGKCAGIDHRSRHNIKYWCREPYLGFGLDAHSMLRLRDSGDELRSAAAIRTANASELAHYAAGQRSELTPVGEYEAFEETVFLGLRMNQGLEVEWLRSQFPRIWMTSCEAAAGEMIAAGMMIEQDGFWRLTANGRLVSNDVFASLLDQVAV